MKRRWLGAALLAAGVAAGTAHGQAPYMPTPVGAARIPEPYPITEPLPPMMPGPLNPYTLPPGPPDSLALPAGHSSAFQTENCAPEQAVFFHFGALALQREKLNSGVLAVQDPIGLDTGIIPAGAPPLIDFNGVDEHMQWGAGGTIGYLFNGSCAIEATGKYLFSGDASKLFVAPGQIDSFFVNPPLGFEGDNGLWLQADQQRVQLTTRLASGEVNYRYTSPGLNEAELILGVRYVDFKENLDITTDDDGILFPLNNGQPDPRRVANYEVVSQNRIVGPQIGFEYDHPMCAYVSFGMTAKAAVGVDFATTNHRLVRGDGFLGFDVQEGTTRLF